MKVTIPIAILYPTIPQYVHICNGVENAYHKFAEYMFGLTKEKKKLHLLPLSAAKRYWVLRSIERQNVEQMIDSKYLDRIVSKDPMSLNVKKKKKKKKKYTFSI